VGPDIPLWRKNACWIIGGVADEKFQRDAWFGKGKYVSSPVEIYNQVFGDLALEEFIASPEIGLNDMQKAAANELIEKMRHFEKLVDEDLPPRQVIDHPVWREVRQTASRLLDLLQCPKRVDD
jgi:hypothetical protein